MEFNGFNKRQFGIFTLRSFELRMPALRAEITPALKVLGEILAPELSTTLRQQLHPHTALHIRRTVNPPVETWVAFGRSSKSYKPFIHLRVAVNRGGVRVVCFVEDDAIDKPVFAAALATNAERIAQALAANPQIYSIDLTNSAGLPLSSSELTAPALAAFANRLALVKAQHAGFAIDLGKTQEAVGSLATLQRRVKKAAVALKPLFDLVPGT